MSDSSSKSSSSDTDTVEGMPFSMQDLNVADLIFEDSSFARGAFGRMVKADYFGVTVCVKILKKQKKKELAKFIHREMAALKTLSHPNLVQFIGATERGNEICLVTEYISGGTLRKLLKDRSIPIPWPIRVQIAVDIASAMAYLHSRKIMHRDLKSKNLLVGDNWKIKICDFGFARSVHDKKKTAALTFCGTEEYMAPEVIFGMEYDERAEVYSYGLLLCELMTRQKVEETVPRTSITNYGLDHHEFKAHVPADCPLEILQLAFLCTEFEPKNRPEFREITKRLREIKQHVNTAPPTPVAPLPHPPTPSTTPSPTPPTAEAPPTTWAPSQAAPTPVQAAPTPVQATPTPVQAAPTPVQATPTPVQAPIHAPAPTHVHAPPHTPTTPAPAETKKPVAQNGTAKYTNAKSLAPPSSPPLPQRTPAPAPFRRSPSAPIPTPAKNVDLAPPQRSLSGSKELPKITPSPPKELPKITEEPASAKEVTPASLKSPPIKTGGVPAPSTKDPVPPAKPAAKEPTSRFGFLTQIKTGPSAPKPTQVISKNAAEQKKTGATALVKTEQPHKEAAKPEPPVRHMSGSKEPAVKTEPDPPSGSPSRPTSHTFPTPRVIAPATDATTTSTTTSTTPRPNPAASPQRVTIATSPARAGAPAVPSRPLPSTQTTPTPPTSSNPQRAFSPTPTSNPQRAISPTPTPNPQRAISPTPSSNPQRAISPTPPASNPQRTFTSTPASNPQRAMSPTPTPTQNPPKFVPTSATKPVPRAVKPNVPSEVVPASDKKKPTQTG